MPATEVQSGKGNMMSFENERLKQQVESRRMMTRGRLSGAVDRYQHHKEQLRLAEQEMIDAIEACRECGALGPS